MVSCSIVLANEMKNEVIPAGDILWCFQTTRQESKRGISCGKVDVSGVTLVVSHWATIECEAPMRDAPLPVVPSARG
jgi:hypothetical protein